MSHKASHWLAEIPPNAMNNGAFRVMFHLCDAHNSKRSPETACFPSQDKLMEATGLSNGGLNNALNELERAGLLIRRRTRSLDGTKGPTYYILGCDFDCPYPTPKSGDGKGAEIGEAKTPSAPSVPAPSHLHSVEMGQLQSEGTANSNPKGPPPPLSGDKPVIEPLKEPHARDKSRTKGILAADYSHLDRIAEKWVGPVKDRRAYAGTSISLPVARRMLERGLVTDAELKAVGIRV